MDGEDSLVLNPFWSLSLNALEVGLGIAAAALLIRSKTLKVFWPMLPITLWGVVPYIVLLLLRRYRILSEVAAYRTYFLTYWSCYAVAAACSVALSYTIFHEALRPLKGLQSLGMIVYRWTAAISVAIGIGVVLLPASDFGTGIAYAASQMQRGGGILVLSLILFVGFAIRPLGLSVRSRVFGVSMGVAFAAAANVYQAGFLTESREIFNTQDLVEKVCTCIADVIWIYYFWHPEPQRKFVLLPTTSPFHAWNQISEILGHDPGYVAIGGVPPEAFAPAELDIFERASRNMALADAGGQSTQFLNRTHYSVSGKRRLADGSSAPSMSASEASELLSSAWERENDEQKKL